MIIREIQTALPFFPARLSSSSERQAYHKPSPLGKVDFAKQKTDEVEYRRI